MHNNFKIYKQLFLGLVLNFNSLHYRRKEIVSGRGHDKENFFERHYFLKLQKQFSEKWGGGNMPPAPRFLRHWLNFDSGNACNACNECS